MEAGELSLVIHRATEAVFTYLANLENDAKWRREWVEAKQTSEGPLGLGATFLLVGDMLGRRNEVVYETIEYEPHRRAAWKTESGPLPMIFRRTFEHVDGGTRVTIRYEVELSGFLKLLKPLVMRLGKHQLAGDLPKLKVLLEARAL
jgi:hypothetical protein